MTSQNPLEFLISRKSTALLAEPGPDRAQLAKIIEVATTAPDHGRLKPYRFVAVTGEARERLGDAFAATVTREKPDADDALQKKARAKAFVSPCLVFLIWSPKEGKIPDWEQQATTACAGFGIALGAHALGFGAIWKSFGLSFGKELRGVLNMADEEECLGWINIGTPKKDDRGLREPVDTDELLEILS